jgi:hypothetical protein
MTVRRVPIFANDIRRIGGTVSVVTDRDRGDSSSHFRVRHISRGGDCEFVSPRIPDQDRAIAAAVVLAAFTGSQVRE